MGGEAPDRGSPPLLDSPGGWTRTRPRRRPTPTRLPQALRGQRPGWHRRYCPVWKRSQPLPARALLV